MKTLSIVIPTLNEEDGVVKVIDAVPKARLKSEGYDVDIVIVDGNSKDRTVERAEAAGARVIYETRKGKGCAIETAFRSISSDYVIMIDGDNTYPAEKIPSMLDALMTFDVVIGSRLRGHIEKGAISKINLTGNYMLTGLANVLYRTKISDLCSGMWGFRGSVTRRIDINAAGFDLEANIFSECVRHGFTIGEVPVDYRVRISRSKLRPLDGFMIAESLLVNGREGLRIARRIYLNNLYARGMLSGGPLRRRNVRMSHAMLLKLQSGKRK